MWKKWSALQVISISFQFSLPFLVLYLQYDLFAYLFSTNRRHFKKNTCSHSQLLLTNMCQCERDPRMHNELSIFHLMKYKILASYTLRLLNRKEREWLVMPFGFATICTRNRKSLICALRWFQRQIAEQNIWQNQNKTDVRSFSCTSRMKWKTQCKGKENESKRRERENALWKLWR